MVPYIHVPDLHIGPIPIHPFGLLVATGVLTGTSIATRRAQKLGYDVVQFNSFVTWMLIAAFLLSHFLDSIFYHWDEVVARPWFLFMPWMGLSSFGGFFGAVVGILLWRYYAIDDGRLHVRPRPMPLLPFADLVLSVLPIGWMFGRAGCATVHDHLGGRASPDTLLAVEHPLRSGDGSVTRIGFIEFIHGHDPRFDLGFLELLFTIVLAACFALTWRRRVPMGSYVIVTAIAYAPVRFAMDFLRLPESEGGDTRYAGLTPAQYGCIALFVFGIAMIPYVHKLRASGVDPAGAVRVPSAKPDAQAIA
ncbi:MAG: prolipoprotein diacylglyceryl transferase family protein [Polyangiaceae bacterium]|jgi:phosphatidylglycerol:prolipoprotein diacylglycerol transferase